MRATVKVLVVDDHPFFRSGITEWLNTQVGITCCGQAGSVAETRRAVARLRPDIILLDMTLPDGDGLDLIPELVASWPETRIIAVSQHDEQVYAHRALRAGARGYIMKSEASEVVLAAIQRVLEGEVYLSRAAAARLTANLFPDPLLKKSPLALLSDRELQVFRLLGSGHAPREVADLLKISIKTVDTYRERLKTKLDLEDSAAVTRAATLWVEKGQLVVN